MKKRERVFFFTQGCRLNQAETALLEGQFKTHGFDVVKTTESADIVIINTCTVTEKGDADTRHLVNRIARKNPASRIALVGCQAQVHKETLLKLPNVKWVIGNAHKMKLAATIQDSSSSPVVIAPKMDKTPFTIDSPPGKDLHHTRANLKIQDGCDFYCSFCVIPFARGPARSRVFDDIIKEAEALARFGHKEVVLTGVNIGTYHYQGNTLVDIVRALEQLNGIHRIRISSIEPTTIPENLIDIMSQNGKLCRYLHIPLQSGSHTVLQRMSRKYSRKEYETFTLDIARKIPNIALGTDVIVGFPGETDKEFQETVECLNCLPLAYFHVFSYSERKYARSKKITPKITAEVIKKRSALLRELSDKKRKLYWKTFLGETVPVLFEQKKNGVWTGLTEHYIRVFVKSDALLENLLLPVRLVAIREKGMEGILE